MRDPREEGALRELRQDQESQFVKTLSAELGAERFTASEKLIKGEFEERKAVVVRSMVLDEAQAHRWPRRAHDSPGKLRGGLAAARARLGAVPTR
ncbi:MAG: hypothetical protein QM756_10960 [Polyangiaceae bacterium]